MSDYDDMMNDYDWYQNTGENREYFEDEEPDYQQNDGGGNSGCVTVGFIALAILGIIFILWLL